MGLCNNVDGEDGEALFTNMIQPKLPLAMFTEIPPSEIPSGGGEQWLTAEVLGEKVWGELGYMAWCGSQAIAAR